MSSFMDKVKATVKSGAEQAATKAQVEFDRISIRRELSGAYEALGTKVYELADRGELSHPELEDPVRRIRELQAQLDAVGHVGQNAPETSPQADPPAEETIPAS